MQIDANVILNFIHSQRSNWAFTLSYDHREVSLLEQLENLVNRELRAFEAANRQSEVDE